MERFKNYLIQEEKSELTVEKYLRDVRRFFVWLGDAELTKNSVLDYKAKLVEEYAVASVNSVISSLNCYFDYIGRNDCRVKAIKQQRQTFSSEEKELTKAEYERLLKAAKFWKARLPTLLRAALL